jgi:hypothetical protein
MLASTDTGAPQIAVPYWDETVAAWKARIAPTADASYSYPYWYLRRDPWHRTSPVEDDVVISTTGLWPYTFDTGWQLLCEYRILKHYKGEEAAAPSYQGVQELARRSADRQRSDPGIAPGQDSGHDVRSAKHDGWFCWRVAWISQWLAMEFRFRWVRFADSLAG